MFHNICPISPHFLFVDLYVLFTKNVMSLKRFKIKSWKLVRVKLYSLNFSKLNICKNTNSIKKHVKMQNSLSISRKIKLHLICKYWFTNNGDHSNLVFKTNNGGHSSLQKKDPTRRQYQKQPSFDKKFEFYLLFTPINLYTVWCF